MSDVAEPRTALPSVVGEVTAPIVNANEPTAAKQGVTQKPATSPTNDDAAVTSSDLNSAQKAGADGDSEAETLIESPEKRKNIADHAPTLQPIHHGAGEHGGEIVETVGLDGISRKRKRTQGANHDETDSIHRASSRRSSPLSSPIPDAPLSESSDSDDSSKKSCAASRHSGDGQWGETASSRGEKASDRLVAKSYKSRKRRSSDIPSEYSKHRSTRLRQGLESASVAERRGTRSATYPQHSSVERSLSPPLLKGHNKPTLTESSLVSSIALNRKKRIPPPLMNSRRNYSTDRQSISSEASSSPAPNRPTLHKFASTENDALSPAKTMGPRKLRDKTGRTFLARACFVNDLDAAKARFEERPGDLNQADNAGNTPLQIASLMGYVGIVEFLLSRGCEVDTKNIDQETSLIDAVENGHVEVVKLLLDHGANPRLANKEGDEPYELAVGKDNEHEIRKLIAQAKDQDTTRRRSDDRTNSGPPREGSSRAASAASPRDSPPMLGPRSPPALSSRRRTGRSEFTRNDLLWQANTQENLTKLAGQGDVQGVASILNILQKTEPEALIAAAKGKHDEVLQYLLGMGDPDPDPDPIRTAKPGFNTPMLAAIGRGNTVVIQLLVEQAGFNPTRVFKGRTYPELSRERKGENWEKELEILQTAYDKYKGSKPRKHLSPRKVRGTSPTHRKTLGSPLSSQKESTSDPVMAVSSDHDEHQPKPQKTRRSQSDLPDQDSQRRQRLVSGKGPRKKIGIVTSSSLSDGDDSSSTVRIKHETKERLSVSKRPRKSTTPERVSGRPRSQDPDLARTMAKKRRVVSDSSPEDTKSTPAHSKLACEEDAKILNDVDDIFRRNQRGKQDSTVTLPTPSHSAEDIQTPKDDSEEQWKVALPLVDAERERDLAEKKEREAAESTRRIMQEEEEARIQATIDAANALARQQEIDNAVAQQRRLEEEILAKRKAEEDAIARRKEEEDLQARLRKEAEERQRRQEERKQREFQEAENRRREALPALLRKTALMLDQGDLTVRSFAWLKKFLPLFTVWTKQIDPDCSSDAGEEEWIPNFQAAGLLATKDLNLRQYTQLEKRDVNEHQREALWRVARNILAIDYHATGFNTSIAKAIEMEEESRPKFMAMKELFWVKVSRVDYCSPPLRAEFDSFPDSKTKFADIHICKVSTLNQSGSAFSPEPKSLWHQRYLHLQNLHMRLRQMAFRPT